MNISLLRTSGEPGEKLYQSEGEDGRSMLSWPNSEGANSVGCCCCCCCCWTWALVMWFSTLSRSASASSWKSNASCPSTTLHHSMSARTLLPLVSEPEERLRGLPCARPPRDWDRAGR